MSTAELLVRAHQNYTEGGIEGLSSYEEEKILKQFGFIREGESRLPLYDFPLVVEIVDPRAELPQYARLRDTGMDVQAWPMDAEGIPVAAISIPPQVTVVIPTGLKVGLPDGWGLQVRPRSGVSLKTPLRVANAPGTIDTDYKDVVGVIIHNSSPLGTEGNFYDLNTKGNLPGTYIINAGDRIAQIVGEKVYKMKVVSGLAASIGSNRGGGFGSTGV